MSGVPPGPDWLPIQSESIVIRSMHNAALEFAPDRVLAHHVLSTGIVAFNVSVHLPAGQVTLESSALWIDYRGPKVLADQLREIVVGKRGEAVIEDYCLSLRIGEQSVGVRFGLLVDGTLTRAEEQHRSATFPNQDRVISDCLINNRPSFATRFAFATNMHLLDDVVAQFDRLLGALTKMGYSP